MRIFIIIQKNYKFCFVEQKNNYYPALTGIRAIAAYMVFVHHGNPFDPNMLTAGSFAHTSAGENLRRVVEQLHIGVAIFFVLSGFLIASRYQDSVKLNQKWLTQYMQNRFARIYPLYFLLTIITFSAWLIDLPGFYMYGIAPASLTPLFNKIVIIFVNLSFLRGFFSAFLLSGVGQGWSLTVEECFYISAPFVLVFSRVNIKWLLLFPVIFFVIGLIIVKLASLSPVHLAGFMSSVKFMLNWTIFGRASEFAVGMGLAFFVRYKPKLQRVSYYFTVIGIICIMGVVSLIIADQYPLYRIMDRESYLTIMLNNLVLPLGVACLFWGLIHEQTILRHVLESSLFQVLGKSSYSFYLVHGGILPFILYKYTSNLWLTFPVVLAVSYLLWRFVEEPLHKKLRAH